MARKIPSTPEAFVAAMAALNVQLPLLPSSDFGVIADATGRSVLTIDVNNERPDEEVELLVAFIGVALNAYAGLQASIEIDDGKAGE